MNFSHLKSTLRMLYWVRWAGWHGSLYTGTLRTNGSNLNFRRLKFQLKLTSWWLPFAIIGAIFKTPLFHRKMRWAGMPRVAGVPVRRPTYSVNSVNLVLLARDFKLLDLLSFSRLLEVRTVTFSSDCESSRKWQSPTRRSQGHHLESCTPGTWQYKVTVVCTGTSRYVP